VDHRDAGHAGARAAALEERREPRREGKRVIYDDPISVESLSSDGGPGVLGRPCLRAGRRSAPGTGVEAFEFVDGVRLHAIGGDQVLLCRVVYEPGKQVPRHAHAHTEQLMCVVEGSVTMTIGDETRVLGPGDVVCVNRGIEHELHSAGGVTFFEALAPVPLDHVPDARRDLVLAEGGATHVAR
jgi:quercetin dioxygenase-like cupin family protein